MPQTGISTSMPFLYITFTMDYGYLDNDELDKDANKKDDSAIKEDSEDKQESGKSTSTARRTQAQSRSRKA
ncbi:ANL_collapsed_G0042220.mRNA.1.CDS.1 [Saccharomyces cerevisiae]|nr:ANL_collapsed_G0042220.mRNA.1.CDS.1 [Saccharomyces cerevisiae]